MKRANLGTISHGTLRTVDLLAAFSGELALLDADTNLYADLIHEARTIDPESDAANELVNEELIDALQTFAPDGAYFGAHPGDGSDFGFWECEE